MTTDVVTSSEPADRESGVWDYVSPSRLNLWLKCPLAFALKYVEGERTPPSTAAFVGRMTHVGLEWFYRHRQLGVPLTIADVSGHVARTWGQAVADEGVVFGSSAEEATCGKQAQDLLFAYLAKLPNNEPRPLAVEVAVESLLVDPQTGEDLGIPLLGVIDLVLPESNGALIADFKTAARSGSPLEITHEIQLSSYAYLFHRATAQPEAALEIRSLIKTKVPQIQFHRYEARSEKHFRRLFAVVRAYLDELDRGRFVFRPGLACGSCEFVHTHCRAWEG